jgi:hypothetical protein
MKPDFGRDLGKKGQEKREGILGGNFGSQIWNLGKVEARVWEEEEEKGAAFK